MTGHRERGARRGGRAPDWCIGHRHTVRHGPRSSGLRPSSGSRAPSRASASCRRTRSPGTCSARSSPGAGPATSSCATGPGSTSTSARTRSTPRPSATTSASSSSHDRAGERILEGLLVDAERRLHEEGIAGRGLPVQEQHRLGRQLLRLPRELPGLPARRVRPAVGRPDPVPGHPADRGRRRQGAADPARRGVLPVPAGRPHLGGRLQRHHPVPADHQHPGRAARRRRAVPPAARHRRRLEHVRDHDAAQGRRDRPGAADDRGRRGRCATTRWRTRSGRSARSATT